MKISPINYLNQKKNNQPAFKGKLVEMDCLENQLKGLLPANEIDNFFQDIKNSSKLIKRVHFEKDHKVLISGSIIGDCDSISPKKDFFVTVQKAIKLDDGSSILEEGLSTFKLEGNLTTSGIALARKFIRWIPRAMEDLKSEIRETRYWEEFERNNPDWQINGG